MNDSRNPRAMDAKPSRTALQSHVAFFDPDSDGIIWPLDTYRGFRQIGSGILFSALCMVVIHSGFSWLTSRFPDPLFRIPISNIHKAIHGSDTGSYTQTGDLDLHRFDTVWEHNTQPPHTHMSFNEGVRMVRGDRNPFDVFGWLAAAFEWGSTYVVLSPRDGRISKQDVQAILDGSLFQQLAKRTQDKKASAVKITKKE